MESDGSIQASGKRIRQLLPNFEATNAAAEIGDDGTSFDALGAAQASAQRSGLETKLAGGGLHIIENRRSIRFVQANRLPPDAFRARLLWRGDTRNLIVVGFDV